MSTNGNPKNSTAASPQSGWSANLTSTSSAVTLVDHNLGDHDLTKVDDVLLKNYLRGYRCTDILEKLKDLAREAGRMMLDSQAGQMVDTKNNTSDVVTETDKAIEEMIQAALHKAFPDILFFGEETSAKDQKLSDKATFICDPIDGTLNFTHGFGNFACSLGMTLFKRPVIGVVYNPVQDEMYSAIMGQGAFLNRRGHELRLPLKKPTDIGPLGKCLMALEWGNDRQGARWELRTSVHKKLLTKDGNGVMIQSIRSLGSAALDFCYVAAGTLDAFWEAGCWPWDVCAGWAILEEAGGRVFSANPYEEVSIESRLYFAVRPGGCESQKVFAEKVWNLMGEDRFVYEDAKKKAKKVDVDEDGLQMASKVKQFSSSPTESIEGVDAADYCNVATAT